MRSLFVLILFLQNLFTVYSQRVVSESMIKEQMEWKEHFEKNSVPKMLSIIRKESSDKKMSKEAVTFLYQLQKAAYQGRFYYSCSYRWKETAKLTGKQVLIFFADLNTVAGTYQSDESYKKNRIFLTKEIKRIYNDYGTIPILSWQFENPYVTSSWTDEKYGRYGYRYRYSSKGYPQQHRYVINEILNNTGDSCGLGRISGDRPLGCKNPWEWFEKRFEEVVTFLKDLKDKDGKPIPIVIRLLHEGEDDWQWWGAGSVSINDYIEFFRYLENNIRSRSRLHNLMFAWSPDRYWDNIGSGDNNDFMVRYPGNRYVDIIGYDDYSIGKSKDKDAKAETIRRVQLVTYGAEKRGKRCGLFETGCRLNPDHYYDILFEILTHEGCRFAFVNTWSPSTIPATDRGKERWRYFLDRPEVVITDVNEKD